MNGKRLLPVFENKQWLKVVAVSVLLFFIYLGDGILSDFVPAYMQSTLNSSLLMGIVMSFSSMVGFGADMIFPQLLKSLKSRRLMVYAIGASLMFAGVLLWTTVFPWILLFLLAMAIWGIYYEFLGFGSQQFVWENVPQKQRSGSWAVMGVFKSLAYFLGPLIGGWVMTSRGNSTVIWVAVFFVLVSYLVWTLVRFEDTSSEPEREVEKINILTESKHWFVLGEHVWPVLLVSLMVGLIDATFWTTGTVLSDVLAKSHWFGGMFLSLYMLPTVILGVIIARLGIYKGKKKIADVAMLVSGMLLVAFGVTDSVVVLLVLSFLSGAALSVVWPMTDAVYSDIVSRMGREGKHMMGLSSSTVSLAYIAGPILSGAIAQWAGERMTFVYIGLLTTIMAIVLLLVTPRKLRLPQEEISQWE